MDSLASVVHKMSGFLFLEQSHLLHLNIIASFGNYMNLNPSSTATLEARIVAARDITLTVVL